METTKTAEPGLAEERQSQGWLLPALALAIVGLAYVLTFRGTMGFADEAYYFAVTRSIVERRVLSIDEWRWLQERVPTSLRGPDEHLYSRLGLGQSLVAIPGYWIGRGLSPLGEAAEFADYVLGPAWALKGVLATSVIISLAMLVATAGMARALAAPWGVTAWIVLATGLGTMAWPYALTNFSEPLTGAALVSSAALSIYSVRTGRWVLVPLATLCLGLAILARPLTAVVVPIVFGYLAWHCVTGVAPWRGLVCGAAVFGGVCLLILWYNMARSGSPLDMGYHGQLLNSASLPRGLAGFLVSPGKGLFWFNPVALLGVACLPRMLRRARVETVFLGTLAGVYLLAHASWRAWEGGWCWGPRFLLPIVPILVVMGMPVIGRLSGWTKTAMVAASSVTPMLGAIADPSEALRITITERGVPAGEYAWSFTSSYVVVQLQRVLAGLSDAPLFRQLSGAAVLASMVVLVIVGCSVVALASRYGKSDRAWRLLATSAVWALVLALGSAVFVLPGVEVGGQPPYTAAATAIRERDREQSGIVYSGYEAFYAGYYLLKDRPYFVLPEDWYERQDALREQLVAFAERGAQTWAILAYARDERTGFVEEALKDHRVQVLDQWFETFRLALFVDPAAAYDHAEMVESGLEFGNAVVLDSYSRLPAELWAPGVLRVVTRWHSRSDLGQSKNVFVHLVRDDLNPVRQADKELQTTYHARGRDDEAAGAFVDVIDVFVDQSVPSGPYRVLLGVYETQSNTRLVPLGRGVDYIELGWLTIQAGQ
ncbi:MAG TPA: hypothetical protein VI789_00540 [Dehalococcoidia bacterium]|nr:hypothetical protein [Dehalococcoidia bacterium]